MKSIDYLKRYSSRFCFFKVNNFEIFNIIRDHVQNGKNLEILITSILNFFNKYYMYQLTNKTEINKSKIELQIFHCNSLKNENLFKNINSSIFFKILKYEIITNFM